VTERGTATATIVFTDVVGSTELRTQLGEVASDDLFREHERRLARAVTTHRGQVVKAAGDGIMAAFDAASDAVTAAVAMQQEALRSSPPLSVRVGVASGDVSWEEGDCFGLPVVTAARLQTHAAGGQILVSQVVRWLAGDRAGDPYVEVGPISLKGLEEPVSAFEVRWEPVATAPAGHLDQLALPAPLATPGTFQFVGRVAEWAVLASAWARVAGGGRHVVLLGGEAGAGKTRLAAEFARHCHAEGASVLFGACDDQLAVPYQPWMQALDHLVRAAPAEFLGQDPHGDTGELALLLPQLERVLPPRRAPAADAEAERFRLFAAVGSFLARCGRDRPVVLVLDDLHWAGAQTLALLRYLVRSGEPGSLLVIGTFRDTGDEITEPLAQALADLRRSDEVERVRVSGLDAEGVEAFVEMAVGQPLDDDLRRLAATMAERSAGNAFYVGELWRHLVNCGAVREEEDGRWVVRDAVDISGVPESVKEVVSARLARLSPAARSVGELASVAGHRTEERILRRAADIGDDAFGAALDELVEANLLAESAGHHLAYAFPHALVRDTVEETVSRRARDRLHLEIADAFEIVFEADRRPVLADLARHFAAGASFGGGPKAVYYGRRAAQQAIRSAAFEEAISYLLAAIAVATPASPEWVDLMLDLGFAQLRSGRFLDCQHTYRAAFAAARDLGQPEQTARAAIGLEQALHMPGLSGTEAIVAVSEAQAMLGDDLPVVGARLQASLARAFAHSGRLDDAYAGVDKALVLGRAAGDEESVSTALEAALIATLDDPERVLALTEELEEIEQSTTARGDPWHLLYSTSHRLRVLVELGRIAEANELLARHRIHSDQFRYAAFQIVGLGFDVVLSLAAGRFDDAEAAAERSFAVRTEDDSPFGSGVYGLQMFAIRREQGRLDEVAGVMRLVAGRDEAQASLWGPGLAALYADLGMLSEARRGFEAVIAEGVAELPRDAVWPASISFLADACVAIGDRERAELLYDEIIPRRGRNLMVGMTVCFGPAERHLANLAALLGRDAAAEEHFAGAFELARRSGSPVWEAHACRDHARFLVDRGRLDRAAQLRARAREIAIELGMAKLAAETEGDPQAAPLEAAPAAPDGLSGRELEVLRLVAAGSSNREIGDALHISQNTVANHVRAILQKTGCANRTEAAAYAARRQLLDA
jgi:class 3 adenylate cyclase/DNA-binding CsgD family transcriptional regulator